MKFHKVTARHDRIVIVASGPSSAGFEPPDGVTVIAVNGAIGWLSRADYWFTLDPSEANYTRMRRRRLGVEYFAAVPVNFGTREADTAVMRRIPPAGIHYVERVTGEGVLRSKPGLSTRADAIHTGNSAFGALGLAYHMHPEKVLLVGVDASHHARVEGGYPRRLTHLPGLFASAIPQLDARGIKVANASEHSQIECFQKFNRAEAVRWLTQ